MNRKSLETIVASLGLLGAISCSTPQVVRDLVPVTETHIVDTEVISGSSLLIPQQKYSDVNKQAQAILDYLTFQDMHAGRIRVIERNITSKDYTAMASNIKSLVPDLEKSGNVYAQLEAKKLKEFTYTIIRVREEKTKYIQRAPRDAGTVIFSPIVFTQGLFLDALGIEAFPEYSSNTEAIQKIGFPEQVVRTESKFFQDQIQVNPYTGKETILRTSQIEKPN